MVLELIPHESRTLRLETPKTPLYTHMRADIVTPLTTKVLLSKTLTITGGSLLYLSHISPLSGASSELLFLESSQA